MRYRHKDEDDRLTTDPLHRRGPKKNPWLLPPFDTLVNPDQVFTRHLVARHEPRHHNETPTGELLIPAPAGATPRRPVRRYMTLFGERRPLHFFIGLNSALPAAFGWVEQCAPTTAEQFAQHIRSAATPDLAAFSIREATFLLAALAPLDPDTPVTVHIADRLDGGTKREQLTLRRLPIALAR